MLILVVLPLCEIIDAILTYTVHFYFISIDTIIIIELP